MSEKKIIAIVGATGAQGGGLARAILNDPASEFAVRAITRDAGSDKARELAALGAEVVEADIDDVDSVTKAFEGAYGAFCVTFFWGHLSAEKEGAEALNMAEAARRTGLAHVIWSTLEDTRRWVPLSDDRMPTLAGEYKVPHFDGKGAADHVFTDAGVPTTFLVTSFYWENFIYFGQGPRRGEDGKLTLSLPMGDRPLPGIAAEDIGRTAYGIFKKGSETIGHTIAIAGEHLTGAEFAAAMSDAFGEPVAYAPMSFETARSLGYPGADDMANMFQFKHDFNDDFVGARDLDVVRSLNPGLQDFRTWLSENASKIPIA